MAVLSASVICLAACASSGGTTSYVPKAQDVAHSNVRTDDAYMARVEFLARRRGIHLTWVNPPTKIVAKQE
jgi:hypothetical protein